MADQDERAGIGDQGVLEPLDANPLTSPAPFDAACDQACDDAYQACLDNATSDADTCNCDNGRIICEHRCGHGGALPPCF